MNVKRNANKKEVTHVTNKNIQLINTNHKNPLRESRCPQENHVTGTKKAHSKKIKERKSMNSHVGQKTQPQSYVPRR